MVFYQARRLNIENDEQDYAIEYLNLDDQDKIVEEILENLHLNLKTTDVLQHMNREKENDEIENLDNDIKRIFDNILRHATLTKNDIDCLEKGYHFNMNSIRELEISKVNAEIYKSGKGTLTIFVI